MDDEDGEDASRRRAQRAQDSDVGLLVGHHHHLSGDDIECRHRHDQGQNDEHDALLDRHRAEKIGVIERPVANLGIDRHGGHQFARDRRRGEKIVELEPNAADGVAHAVKLLRVREVDQSEPVVEFEHADLEHAHDVEALDPGQRARGRHRALRNDDHHRVAGAHAQRPRKLGAKHDAEFAGFKRRKQAAAHMHSDVSDGVFERRIDAADKRSAILLRRRQHRLAEHIRCLGFHSRVGSRRARDGLPILHISAQRVNLDVRSDRKYPIAQLILKPIHDRKHDDQRRDTKRNASHGSERDERHKTVAAGAAAGPGIAQSDKYFVGRQQDLVEDGAPVCHKRRWCSNMVSLRKACPRMLCNLRWFSRICSTRRRPRLSPPTLRHSRACCRPLKPLSSNPTGR